jgi:hypothetical protein
LFRVNYSRRTVKPTTFQLVLECSKHRGAEYNLYIYIYIAAFTYSITINH